MMDYEFLHVQYNTGDTHSIHQDGFSSVQTRADSQYLVGRKLWLQETEIF